METWQSEGAQLSKSLVLDERIRKEVLPRFPVGGDATIAPFGGGLINQTFLVGGVAAGVPTRWILQRVNPLFPAAIHQNIRAVTAALARCGLTTPRLVPTHEGALALELPSLAPDVEGPSVWRLMTYVSGASFDVVATPAQARAAGDLVARFHTAVDHLPHEFVGLRASVHDTPRHLEHLRQSLSAHRSHRLFAPAAALGARVLEAAQALPALPSLPPRICHGDLKFNNLLFAGTTSPEREKAVCLIDLDTVGPMALAFEMGDAWRSWCNRKGEDEEQAEVALDIFEASLDGYCAGLGRAPTADERSALLLGPEWISLELSARFAADAVVEAYFGWNSRRFAGRGEHNLVRARGQFSLHEALVASRPLRARLLGTSS